MELKKLTRDDDEPKYEWTCDGSSENCNGVVTNDDGFYKIERTNDGALVAILYCPKCAPEDEVYDSYI
ncbi:MAG: hypothetical protein ACXABY_31190 [Candidatus Thorarchaeota archaeon]|jgi:hypothetical protein